jgi:hypothetical protein
MRRYLLACSRGALAAAQRRQAAQLAQGRQLAQKLTLRRRNTSCGIDVSLSFVNVGSVLSNPCACAALALQLAFLGNKIGKIFHTF